MCTAVTYQTEAHYFGRNLDLEYSYHENVTITPRNYPFLFREASPIVSHYAMIGMATVVDGYPLYYEATNEKGLSMAGLNFPGLAYYPPTKKEYINIAPFELIPWILGQCSTISEAKAHLARLNLADIPFSEAFPLSPLHWIIADSSSAITVEPTASGLRVYDNPVGILTNNPPFDYHLYHLSNYQSLSPNPPSNHFAPKHNLLPYSNGMGGIGLPGDFSSASRFVKAAFVKLNSPSALTEEKSISHFFHILNSVSMPRGSVCLRDDQQEITLYSCCCNTDKGIYYYTTYDNSRITAVNMHQENLEGTAVIQYPLMLRPDIFQQN